MQVTKQTPPRAIQVQVIPLRIILQITTTQIQQLTITTLLQIVVILILLNPIKPHKEIRQIVAKIKIELIPLLVIVVAIVIALIILSLVILARISLMVIVGHFGL